MTYSELKRNMEHIDGRVHELFALISEGLVAATEALLASASQFFEFSASAVQLEREPEGMRPLSRTLNCSKIRNTFAIRQVPWRSAIGDLVKHYYEQQ